MPTVKASTCIPSVFINHGGGPMPLLGQQPKIVANLKEIAAGLPRPSCIIVISAHFEADVVTIMTAKTPPINYDYCYKHPAEAYSLSYPARTDGGIISRIRTLLGDAGIEYKEDDVRGFDQGMFVPLLLMYPDASIPIIGVAQPSSMDPKAMWSLGAALAPLRQEGVLILGSGASIHNFAFTQRSPLDEDGRREDIAKTVEWDAWLTETVCMTDAKEREKRLKNWEKAPHARFAHPREEHLMPLVAVAAAARDSCGVVLRKPDPEGLRISEFKFEE